MVEIDAVAAVCAAAGLSDDDASWRRADNELGNQLVAGVQEFLAAESNEWDVDLFFETYGRPPRDGSSWSAAILSGLDTRSDLPQVSLQRAIDESRLRAVNALREQGQSQ